MRNGISHGTNDAVAFDGLSRREFVPGICLVQEAGQPHLVGIFSDVSLSLPDLDNIASSLVGWV